MIRAPLDGLLETGNPARVALRKTKRRWSGSLKSYAGTSGQRIPQRDITNDLTARARKSRSFRYFQSQLGATPGASELHEYY